METFGQILRKRRKEKGWSLAELVRRSHTEKGYLSAVENGKLRASPRKAVLIAEALGLDPKDMVLRVFVERAPVFVREELCERVFGPEVRVKGMLEQYLRARRHVSQQRFQDALRLLGELFNESFPGAVEAALRHKVAPGRAKPTRGQRMKL